MMTARLMAALIGSAFINLNMTTCHSPGEGDAGSPEAKSSAPARVKLKGVDTSDLSPREQTRWSAHVSELLAPCDDTPVSVAKCVEEKRSCSACVPAAEYLVEQVRQGKTAGQVESAYKERFSSDAVIEIPLAGSPSKGSPNAPITLVEFADFECGVCKAASAPLDAFVKANADVRLVFKNFPLGFHENAEGAARASVAADLQGKFWEMHHALFASHNLTESGILQIAKDLGLDLEKFKKDLRSEEVADAVSRDRKQGEAAKVNGTPTIYVNGRKLNYATDLKSGLESWIKLERKLVPQTKSEQKAKPVEEKKDDAPNEAAPSDEADAKAKPAAAKPEAPAAAKPVAPAAAKPVAPAAPKPAAPAPQGAAQ